MKNLLTLGFTLTTAVALAQTTPTTSDPALAVPPPAAPVQATPSPLTYYGYVDGY